MLNEKQLEAVKFKGGPLLVIAGAGSGKTRTLTHRVAYMVNKLDILPSRMFVTTFTNKAAEEMSERLDEMMSEQKVDRLKIGTFHSLCYKIMKDLMEWLDADAYETPRIIMGGGRFMVIKGIQGKHEIKGSPKDWMRVIGLYKNNGIRVSDLKKKFELALKENPKAVMPEELIVYEEYQKVLQERNQIDFDDMLFKTYWMLNSKKATKFRERLQNRIDRILVDEGQDLNPIQFMLLDLLCGDRKEKVTMVLDDWQTLYGFRGARVESIHRFIEKYKPTIIKLEQNYRSTQEIVGAGNKLIAHNKGQVEKTLFTDNEIGLKPHVIVSTDPDDEAQRIFEEVEALVIEGGYEFKDIAILFRTNSQARALVDFLVMREIPHKVFSNSGFYDRSEVKDLCTYLRIVVDPHDAMLEDFRRIINRPTRYLGAAYINRVEDFQLENNIESYFDAMRLSVHQIEKLSAHQRNQAQKFVDQIQRIHNWFLETRPSTGAIIKRILDEIPYINWLLKEDDSQDEPDDDKKMNMESTLAGMARFNDPYDFLRFIDSISDDAFLDGDDFLSLMTIHKSKGTEYPVIFLVGVCEGLLPHYLADDMEEERRVAYVGATRAKEQLFVSFIHGKYNRKKVTGSRFIQEMGLQFPQTFGGQRVGYVSPCASPKDMVVTRETGVKTIEESFLPEDKKVDGEEQTQIQK